MDKEKSKCKVTTFVKSHWRKICAGFVVLLILLCILSNIEDGYNYISALANVVIATSAVLAYLTARNYLPQLTTQEGYKIAIQLVNGELQSTQVIDDAIIFVKQVDALLSKINDTVPDANVHIKMRSLNTDFEKHIKNVRSYERSIHHYVSTMKTYGLEPAPDRKLYFEAFCNNLNLVNSLLTDVMHTLPIFKNLYENTIQDREPGYAAKYDRSYNKENDKKFKHALDSLVSEKMALISHRLSFFGEKRQIGKLFVVNQD